MGSEKKLQDNEKYNIFIDNILKNKTVWILQATEGLCAIFEDDSIQEYIPVWPDEKTAKLHAKDDWADYLPEKMNLFEFMGWLKELAADKVKVAVWPDEDMQTIPMQPLEIKKHLEEQIKAS